MSDSHDEVEPAGVRAGDHIPATGDDVPATGDEAIDEALTQLAGVEDEPLAHQIEVGEAVHRVLQGRLGGLSDA